MKLRAIDRKVFRDLREMWAQGLAIAFVILAGVATYVSMTSVMDSLQGTLAGYYREYRFADGFASVRRAPEALLVPELRDIPGIAHVETRVTAAVNLEVGGFDEPVSGMLVSIPDGRQPELNRLYVRRGRIVHPGEVDAVLLNESFADAHGLAPGDELGAIVNGRRRTLEVVGIALSPEFLMQLQPGAFFPDPERYGILWMGRPALAAARDMEGAFNDVAVTFTPGASPESVLERMDRLLGPYGGLGAHAREDQPSHFLITEEFRQLRTMATLLPGIFLLVAAFLLNIVVTRLIALQREQIAVLKAFGYRDLDIGLHYLKLVFVIALAGSVGGTVVGAWLGHALGGLYLEFYRFPALDYVLRPTVVAVAVALTSGAAFAGTAWAVTRAVRLPPAEAMRPAPPARYHATALERWGLRSALDQPTRMILRNLGRQPLKASLTVAGIGSSCAILVMGLFWGDSIDHVVRVQYGLAQRGDLTVSFTEPASTAAGPELASLPGVRLAEPFRTVPVRLRHGHRSRETSIEGIPREAYLRRPIDADLDPVEVPAEGILLSDRLGEILQARRGDRLTVEVLEGARATRSVPVAGITRQFLGMGAYMELDAASRLAGAGASISGAYLLIDGGRERALVHDLRRRPRVAAISSQARSIEAYYETSAESMLTFTFVLSLFASVIAFGVVYNSARIALSERGRELASLRVLGFTRGEVSYILLGELTVLVLLALPIGLAAGAGVSAAIVRGLETDMYRIPIVLGRRTLTTAATLVLAAAAVSALVVRRRVNRLDLVGVLKTRE